MKKAIKSLNCCLFIFFLLTLFINIKIIQSQKIQKTSSEVYKKYLNTYDPQAKCLDGTPPLFYIHQGKQTKKFLIFLQGGGYCGSSTLSKTLQSCYQRSKTLLGSSKYWPQTFPSENMGYLDTDPQKNQFAQYTKFIFGYCDGAIHQGYSEAPINYKDAKLYFRGSAITKSHFNFINEKYGLFQAQTVVFTGGSAGGVANFYWSNYLRSKLTNPNAFMITVPDSGIFIDSKSIKTGKHEMSLELQNLFQLSNKNQSNPLSQCATLFPKEGWKCFFFQNFFPFLKGEFLIINSQYDSWAIPNDLHQSCLTKGMQQLSYTLKQCSRAQISRIEEYRKKYLQVVTTFVQLGNQKSVWSISCSAHVYACMYGFYNDPRQKVNNTTVKQALKRAIIDRQKVVLMDILQWPKNLGCAY